MEIRAIDLIAAVRSAMPAGEGDSFVLDSAYGEFLTFRNVDTNEEWAVRYSVEDGKVELHDEPTAAAEVRAVLTSKARNALADSDFAYIDSKGGRHLPVHDAKHVSAALGRFSSTDFDSPAAKASAAKKICAAAKACKVDVADTDDVAVAARAEVPATEDRAADPTVSNKNTRSLLEGACATKFGDPKKNKFVYVSDFSDSWVVYDCGDAKFQATYSVDGDTVTLGDPVQVTEEHSYTPLQTNSAKPAVFSLLRKNGRRQRRDLAPAMEHRRYDAEMRIRDVDKNDNLVTLRGTPIVYDAAYKVRDMLGEFNETMRRGVATDLINSPSFNCRFLYDHKGMVMASTAPGTLKFEDRKTGLDTFPTIDIRSPSAMDLYVAVERGDVRSMSIGFMVNEKGEKWDSRQENREVFKFVDMPDVSAVAFPASTTTSIILARSAFASVPAESRERLRRLYPLAKQVRSGQALSQADGDLLIRAIEALYEADDLDESTLVEAFRSLQSPEDVENTMTALTIQRQRLALANARSAAL